MSTRGYVGKLQRCALVKSILKSLTRGLYLSIIYDSLLMLLYCNYVCSKTFLPSTLCCLSFNHDFITLFATLAPC